MSHAIALLSILVALLTACSSPEPTPIAYGKDECAECKMTISDSKFGSEALTSKSKVYKFDSPECMLAWYGKGNVAESDLHSLWVTDFIRPGELINARTAFYLESMMLHSPMGMNYAAFETAVARERAQYSYPGTQRTFDEALAAAKEH